MKWIMQMKRLNKWWSNNHQMVAKIVKNFAYEVRDLFENLANNIARMIVISIIMTMCLNYFYPEFSVRFPVLYDWFDGFVQLGEFLIKTCIGFIYAIFTGNLGEFLPECRDACSEIIKQFVDWIRTIQF